MTDLFSSGFILLIAQIACVVHLFRNDRSWLWLLVLFLIPLFGVLAYFLVEVLGGSKKAAGSIKFDQDEPRSPGIRQLERVLEDSPTVENRAKLARACLQKGQAARAVKLYEECLTGVYRDDLPLWYEAAEAYQAAGDGAAALEALDRLDAGGYSDYGERRALIRGLALERVGHLEDALEQLRLIVETSSSAQARYEYARLLLKAGKQQEAAKVVEQLMRERSRHDRRHRQREAHWYRLARKLPVARNNV